MHQLKHKTSHIELLPHIGVPPGTLHIYVSNSRNSSGISSIQWRLRLRMDNKFAYYESSLDKTWISSYDRITKIVKGDFVLGATNSE